MTEQEKSIKLLTWAYMEGFKAASKTLDATVKSLDMELLEENFSKMLTKASPNEGDEDKSE